VLIFAICSVVYYLVGYGIAFGDDGGPLIGGSGFFPSVDDLLAVGEAPFSWFASIPAGAGYLFQVVFAGVSLAIVWGAMAERTKLWVYFAFGVVFTLIYSVVSHWIWHEDGWLFDRGMQDFAGSTVVHYQGALAALAGALLLGPRIGKFDGDGRPNAIPGHNMAYVTLGVLVLWFGWFGFNPGSTLGVVSGDRIGYFAYVALTTNVAAAAGALGGVLTSWLVIKKPDLSMMLNGVIAALVAVTAASGFVAPWAAIVIGAVAGAIAVLGVLLVERIRIDDPIGAVAVHGMAGVWGTLATGIFAVPALAENLATGAGGLWYTGSFDQLGTQALGLLAVGAFTFSASFGALWLMKQAFGIRVEPEVETAGLDVSEHGMWGYPEFYIPVPGGYGTEAHGHLGLTHSHRPAPAPAAAQAGALEPAG
jgi:Amt family ammonium transporter